jgi:hypothetical protein
MALLDFPPVEWDEAAVSHFHEILFALQEAFGMDLSEFRIPDRLMMPIPPYVRRMPRRSGLVPPISYSRLALAQFAWQQIETLYLLLEPPVNDPMVLKTSHQAVRAERDPAQSQAGPGNASRTTPEANAQGAVFGEAADAVTSTNSLAGDSQELRNPQAPTGNLTTVCMGQEGAPPDGVGSPEDRLRSFIRQHPGTTYADVKYSAKVHTAEFQDWRRSRLKTGSVMSQRIESVLIGKTSLKKKPGKRRGE